VRRKTGQGGSAGAASGKSRRGGRKAGTGVLDGFSAPEPVETRAGLGTNEEERGTTCPGNGNEQIFKTGARGSADIVEAPSETDVPGQMSHEDQLAQANWTAAILKVDELKPKSYKDYNRALKTYKVHKCRILFCSWCPFTCYKLVHHCKE
jgi:hypothetical protein